jgi:glycosyltransferase involved in cell wall biosynthesis
MPEISVLLPTYNREHYLKKAIDSVLAQRNVDLELIVSDNASTDGTPQMLEAYRNDARVRYHRSDTNIGMVGNWRKLVFDLAKSDWFMLLSDDDYLVDNDYLCEAMSLIRHERPIFVYAGAHLLDSESGEMQELVPPFSGVVEGLDVFASRGTVQPQDIALCNMIFPRNAATRLGFLANPDNLSCDSEFYLKLAVEGRVGVIPHPVCVYRIHAGNLIKTVDRSARLMRGNLDFLVNPYVHALACNVPKTYLERYRENTKMVAWIDATLFRLALYDRKVYHETLSSLCKTIPSIMQMVGRSVSIRIKLGLALNAPWLLRNRYKIGP